MGGVIAKMIFKSGNDGFDLAKITTLNDIPCKKLDGEETTIGKLIEGKKLYMIVNVASK